MHFSAYRVELTYNYGVDSYPLGDGFGHFGLAVNDVYKTAESIQSSGEFIVPYAQSGVKSEPFTSGVE